MMGVTQAHAKPEGGAVKDCTSIMSELRIIKDDEEIERIKTAAKVAENGVRAAIEAIRPGITESQVAAEAEYAMRQAGAEEFWRTNVSSGERTNIAHGVPSPCRLVTSKEKRTMIYQCFPI
jgi:Xaa-Pro aminopeptidase